MKGEYSHTVIDHMEPSSSAEILIETDELLKIRNHVVIRKEIEEIEATITINGE